MALWTFFLAILLYLALITILWLGVRRATRTHVGRAQPAVTVVIAARNEAENIAPCLQALAKQTYPRRLWQVIVVDDRSADRTGEVAAEWSSHLPRFSLLRIDRLPDGKQGKKHALELGVTHATGDVILTTDADCRPPPRWIEAVAGRFDATTDVAIGTSCQRFSRDGWWTRTLEIDGLAAGVAAAAGVGLGTAVTCSGRNLAYRRSLFVSNNGFSDLHRSVSGDDDLFVHRLKREHGARLAFVADPEAEVPSLGPRTLKGAFRQRLRHLSAGRYYPRRVLAGYAAFHFCNLLVWAGLLAAGLGAIPWGSAIAAWATKVAADAALLGSFARRTGQQFNPMALLPWEIYFLVGNLLLAPVAAFVQSRWRG